MLKKCIKKCVTYNYLYLFDKVFMFHGDVCNGCLDLLLMSINLNGIAIFNIWSVNYCCIIKIVSNTKAVNLLQNDDLSKNSETLKNKNLKMGTKYHIKMGKKIIKFGDVELEKQKFHCHKNPIFLNYVNVANISI